MPNGVQAMKSLGFKQLNKNQIRPPRRFGNQVFDFVAVSARRMQVLAHEILTGKHSSLIRK